LGRSSSDRKIDKIREAVENAKRQMKRKIESSQGSTKSTFKERVPSQDSFYSCGERSEYSLLTVLEDLMQQNAERIMRS